MPLVTTKEMLNEAFEQGYGVGAFNAENMEMAQAIISAAEECRAPVIVQTTPSTVKYADCGLYMANVRTLAENASVPVAMHLDHGESFVLAIKALRAGYTSIMIDGSRANLEENIAISTAVAKACHAAGIPVEAELGKVGGKEDSLDNGDVDIYTDTEEAVEFTARTGIDFLAVGIGTAHGIYKGEPKLNLERLAEIHAAVPVPLVLHGTSGVPDETVKACIKLGISKINYATDLRIAYTKGVREILRDNAVFDPKKYGKQGREYVKRYVAAKMQVCGCCGKT